MTGKNKLIHTPEGVRDIYNGECRKKLAIQEKILNVFYLYGYEHIQTPSFEFFDIFSKDRGSVSSQEMFKFFDRDNNTLVLRPDMTPAVARCVAKYFMDDPMPLRLCYLERTFKNNSSYQGRLKERAESGAELIGDDCADADAEVIAMVIDSLKAAGLKEFQVELGHVAFYRSLAAEAGLAEETEEELLKALEPGYINGLSLLGGEPFEPENQEVLVPFLRKVRERYPDKTVWCYSGYLFDKELLRESRARCGLTDEMLSMIDILVDGRFVESLKDITLVFRGSSNQRVIDVKKSLERGDVVLWEQKIKRGMF